MVRTRSCEMVISEIPPTVEFMLGVQIDMAWAILVQGADRRTDGKLGPGRRRNDGFSSSPAPVFLHPTFHPWVSEDGLGWDGYTIFSPQRAEEFSCSLALLCKPYILTYMKDARIQERYRRTITSHRRRALAFVSERVSNKIIESVESVASYGQVKFWRKKRFVPSNNIKHTSAFARLRCCCFAVRIM